MAGASEETAPRGELSRAGRIGEAAEDRAGAVLPAGKGDQRRLPCLHRENILHPQGPGTGAQQARPVQGSCQASVCHDVLASGQRAPQVLGTPSPAQLSLMRELGRAGTQSTPYFQGFPAPRSQATWDGALRMTVRGAEPTFGEGFTAAPPLPEAAFITGVPLTKRRLCFLGSMNPPLVTCLLSGKSAPFPPRTRLSSAPRAGCVPEALRGA